MSHNIVIIGGAGMGKGELGEAIPKGKAIIVEPYRARKDGARKGERYFIAPEVLLEMLRLNKALDGAPVLHYDSDIGNVDPYGSGDMTFRSWLEVYESASFFMVRDTAQVLLHHEPQRANVRKLEMFAPVLSMILGSRAREAIPFFADSMTIFVHLNPLPVSIMDVDPSNIANYKFAEDGWDWEKIQKERNKIVKGDEKSEDVAVRMALLPDEAIAWQALFVMAKDTPGQFAFVDCTGWGFFECKFLNEQCSHEDAVKRLLECVEQQTPDLQEFFSWLFDSAELGIAR